MYNPIAEFNEYMLNFYGIDGTYDYGFTNEEVETAKNQHIANGADFQGDSFDREQVRDIVLENRKQLLN